MTARFVAKSALAVFVLAAVAATGIVGAAPANARVFVGFGFAPYWGYPYAYPYPYSYPYPYPAQPVVYAPSYVPADPDYAAQPAAAAPATWYYCDAPAGYYPYVQHCSTPWRPVPATPQREE
ncbi:MAG: hypothetical protein ACREFC_09175 [Stellaceae bacterium]